MIIAGDLTAVATSDTLWAFTSRLQVETGCDCNLRPVFCPRVAQGFEAVGARAKKGGKQSPEHARCLATEQFVLPI